MPHGGGRLRSDAGRRRRAGRRGVVKRAEPGASFHTHTKSDPVKTRRPSFESSVVRGRRPRRRRCRRAHPRTRHGARRAVPVLPVGHRAPTSRFSVEPFGDRSESTFVFDPESMGGPAGSRASSLTLSRCINSGQNGVIFSATLFRSGSNSSVMVRVHRRERGHWSRGVRYNQTFDLEPVSVCVGWLH